jgi:hypothetical protein
MSTNDDDLPQFTPAAVKLPVKIEEIEEIDLSKHKDIVTAPRPRRPRQTPATPDPPTSPAEIPDNIRRKLTKILQSSKNRYAGKGADGMNEMITDLAEYFHITLDPVVRVLKRK